MKTERGTTAVNAAASIAVALVIVLISAASLSALADRVDRGQLRDSAHALLGVQTAHAQSVFAGQNAEFAVPGGDAPLLIRSHRMPLSVAAGTTVTLSLGFKNNTGRDWNRGTASTALLSRADAQRPSAFMATSWIDTMSAASQDDRKVDAGSLALFTAQFRAPDEPGTYTERFALRSLDGQMYPGSETVVTFDVAAPTAALALSDLNPWGAPSSVVQAKGSDGTDPFFIPLTVRYPEEPIIRIGIEFVEPEETAWFPHVITSAGAYRVEKKSGEAVLSVPAGEKVAVDYTPSTGIYHLKHGSDWYKFDEPLRFLPEVDGQLMQLPAYTKKLVWEGNTADNIFRGILEVRFVPETDRLWAINELGIEDYLRGIVETSDGAHPEFHKAQIIAARTFALYHYERGGKYPKGEFILRNDARDQVYRGENAAARRPRLVQAAESTRGIVATYDNDVVVTPYFAQSDGQTKSWTQAWGGIERAWLTGVADPVCDGRTQLGHGVGLAQRCAMTLANNGWRYESILYHYYPGIQLKKIYE
jgi:hypothetical protein